MNLKIRTFSMALAAMSATSYMYALPSNNIEEKSSTKEKKSLNLEEESVEKNKKEERNVMLNAADANKPREIQIGLPSEDVTVYENGLPAVYSSSVHKLSAHWRGDASLKGTDLMTPSESAIATGNIAYAVSSFSELGQKEFKGKLNYKANHFGMQNLISTSLVASVPTGSIPPACIRTSTREVSSSALPIMQTAPRFIISV